VATATPAESSNLERNRTSGCLSWPVQETLRLTFAGRQNANQDIGEINYLQT